MTPSNYESTAPYFVAYEWRNHNESWNVPTLREALINFWQDGHLSQPMHRVVSDYLGRVILEERDTPPRYNLFATNEVWQLIASVIPDGPPSVRLERIRAESKRVNGDV